MSEKWDFSGWATKSGIRCSDGRTIRRGAFKDCDGKVVPLVWNHNHNDISEVLGHALLEDRDGDIYAYCSFNKSEKGQDALERVQHGDIRSLSIYANNLQQTSRKPPCDVVHGTIREVSLVLAGANVGAYIDNVMAHSEDGNYILEDEAVIYHAEEENGLSLYHASDDDQADENGEGAKSSKEETVGDVLATLSDKQKAAVGILLEEVQKGRKEADTNEAVKHSADSDDDDDESADETIGDIINTLSPKQKKAVEALVGMALSDKKEKSNKEEKSEMMHHAFDTYEDQDAYFAHSELVSALNDALAEARESNVNSLKKFLDGELKHGGALGDALAHAQNADSSTQSYGIADIDYLFPEAKTLNNTPEFIQRDMSWVDDVMNGTHHTPFARVKSMFADITEDEARARGYVKGNKKAEEVFTLLKRTTDPQTIYKKQKLDRDDIVDITDFDVVAWLKGEMQLMLKEEVARAILISDGRSTASNDKIKEDHIRPIASDDDLYTVKVPVKVAANATEAEKAEALEDAVIRAFKDYKGSGNPTFFTTKGAVTEMLLRKDKIGHKIYKTTTELATALRVSKISEVEVMENQKISIDGAQKDLIGVVVNMKDYNIGTNRGGQTTFFDDFDIDYNQYKYLYETRLSGALVKPYSALSFYWDTTTSGD